MKRLFTLMLILASTIVVAQNGGQSAENNVVKVEFMGHTTIDYYKVTSKQNCNADYRINYNGLDSIITIPPLGNTIIGVTHINGEIFKAKAVQGTTCNSQPDMGWVEVTSGLILALQQRNILTSPLRARGIIIYPTIVSGSLNIKIGRDVKKPFRVEIYSVSGSPIVSLYSFSDNIHIELSTLPVGVYIVSMTDGNGKLLGGERIVKN